ncbi:MAG: anaerobic ribonucleoside-triphosphate reductase activating protein [Deltaproteobacteria bacterium]|nr:anaerobic ribonucleoside-triphosphate reductase activating protein [Candidatus Anaeroferrophillus wilburensis]MBN2888373.1 anaerobic ribonucleoside-triphosphate reductase activating protein [Deltaproteobacteria bacterium]
MQIKGFIESSCSDWPGQVVAVLFLPGCNFRCPYCHNQQLVLSPGQCETFDQDQVFAQLAAMRCWLDGVCISGGEPTLHYGLADLCGRIKQAGFRCKVDTNGSQPAVLASLLAANLLDFVAMDIKAPLLSDIYRRCAGVEEVDLAAIKQSMTLLRASGIDYQFRTTYHPFLLSDDALMDICRLIHPGEEFVLQQARTQGALDPGFSRQSEMTDEQFQQVNAAVRQMLEKKASHKKK